MKPLQGNWEALIFGTYNIQQVQDAVADTDWQETRVSMLGTSIDEKYATLCRWLECKEMSERAKIQVTNYVHALRRGGLI